MADSTITLSGEVILSRTIGNDSFPDFQSKVWFTLVSSDLDENGYLKISARTQIEEGGADEDDFYQLSFTVPSDFGEPGALLVESKNVEEFYLQTLNLEALESSVSYVFACNSWVNKTDEASRPSEALEGYTKVVGSQDIKIDQVRIFFINKACLPKDTPAGLKTLRALEMELLRGDGTGERKPSDRIYDYDVYNDLGNPRASPDSIRPTLGGPGNIPYPRRCRTGREIDEASGMETVATGHGYVPRDSEYTEVRLSSSKANLMNAMVKTVIPTLRAKLAFHETPDNFDSLQEMYDLYKPLGFETAEEKKFVEEVLISKVFGGKSPGFPVDVHSLEYPTPEIIQDDPMAWMTDEEFGRQNLSGMNPMVIRRAEAFPPTSTLPEDVYGPGTNLTNEDIEPFLITEGREISVAEAITQKRLFTVDYHDLYLPFVHKINSENLDDKRFIYAPRAFFFLTDDKKLKPVAVELSLPPPQTGEATSQNRIFTPPKEAHQTDFGWELAKLHFTSVDLIYHQVISHWVQCHAVMEPIIIAGHRQLSVMHPIFVLLEPTFVDTLRTNGNNRAPALAALAAHGPAERNFTTGPYTNEIGAVAYDKFWRFDEVGLPQDLLARGMAEPDQGKAEGVTLLFDDYPFAKDALDIWNATKEYLTEYVQVYYETDEAVASDEELQEWWKEVREVGHEDKKDADWWPSCKTVQSLIDILCTIVYITAPKHAATHFGMYAYAGFMPNRPTMTRKPIPEPNTPEYKEMLFNFERFMLRTISSTAQTGFTQAVFSVATSHAEDEQYLGQRLDSHWTSDPRALAVLRKFADELERLEDVFKQRNDNSQLSNRFGALKSTGYTFLYPSSEPGRTSRGVPWNV